MRCSLSHWLLCSRDLWARALLVKTGASCRQARRASAPLSLRSFLLKGFTLILRTHYLPYKMVSLWFRHDVTATQLQKHARCLNWDVAPQLLGLYYLSSVVASAAKVEGVDGFLENVNNWTQGTAEDHTATDAPKPQVPVQRFPPCSFIYLFFNSSQQLLEPSLPSMKTQPIQLCYCHPGTTVYYIFLSRVPKILCQTSWKLLT